MAQLFSPRSGLRARLFLIAAVLLVCAGIGSWRALGEPSPARGTPAAQPIAFSHAHHVGEVGLDCRYCHTGVETGPVAGIPPLSTCMTCHSQLFTEQDELAPLIRAYTGGQALRWQRVHALPDFVYFDHSVHLANGVGCESCHGRVDHMQLTERTAPLTMGWCLQCHRNPAAQLRPRSAVFAMGYKADDQQALGQALARRYHVPTRKLSDCSTCHR